MIKRLLMVAAAAFYLCTPTTSFAQHSNWDWLGSGFQVQTDVRQPSAKARSYVRVGPVAAQSSVGLNLFGTSWLEANIGATRPHGAPGAWCGYAMRLESQSLGYGDPGPAFNVVSSWCSRGHAVPAGTIGAVAVSAGHVSKVVAGNCPPGTVATLSGNATARRVSHMCEPISRMRCWRSMG